MAGRRGAARLRMAARARRQGGFIGMLPFILNVDINIYVMHWQGGYASSFCRKIQ
jgi:hypothetical protein